MARRRRVFICLSHPGANLRGIACRRERPMYFSAHQIAESREQALNNLFGLSSALLESGQRLSELFANAGREALHHGSRQLSQFGHGQLDALLQQPATLWLESSVRGSKLLDSACDIVGAAHKALIESADAQVRLFDQLVLASLDRAARNSPWEAEIAFGALRTTLHSAEQTLHGINAAAIETVDLAEQETHLLSTGLAAAKPAPARRSAVRKKNG
jgi:hypothetical protein